MVKIAALLLAVGSGCHMADPRGVWTNGIWATSAATATLAVLSTGDGWIMLKKAALLSAGFTMLSISLGCLSLLKKVKKQLCDESEI